MNMRCETIGTGCRSAHPGSRWAGFGERHGSAGPVVCCSAAGAPSVWSSHLQEKSEGARTTSLRAILQGVAKTVAAERSIKVATRGRRLCRLDAQQHEARAVARADEARGGGEVGVLVN